MTPSNGLRTVFERPTRTLFSRVRRVGPQNHPQPVGLLRKTLPSNGGSNGMFAHPPYPLSGFAPGWVGLTTFLLAFSLPFKR